jgi:hypothetical protein
MQAGRICLGRVLAGPRPWVVAELPFPERLDHRPGVPLAGSVLDNDVELWTRLVR